jgi:ATP-dependent Clp protease ATP-binding subunit ClpC
MNISTYLKTSPLYSVISVENSISGEKRKLISKINFYCVIATVILLGVSLFGQAQTNTTFYKIMPTIEWLIPALVGFISINIGIFLAMKLLNFQFSCMYYFDKISGNKYAKSEIYTFSAGRILYAGKQSDILHAFLLSDFGIKVLKRLEFTSKEIKDLTKNIPENINSDIPDNFIGKLVKVSDVIDYIFDTKKDFSEALMFRGIKKNDLIGASEWIIYDTEKKEYDSQWWRKTNLAKIEGFAKEWSFGQTFTLNKFGIDLLKDESVNSEALPMAERENEVIQIENALSKMNEANALVVGEPGQEKIEIIWVLCRHIKNKSCAIELADKRPILFDTNFFTSYATDKITFENTLKAILSETEKTGNIILVIDNLSRLIDQGNKLEVDVISLLDPSLTSPNTQIIALSDIGDFREKIEKNKNLMSRFEIVLSHPFETKEISRIISSAALKIEKDYGLFFSYQAISEISKSADYYFTGGVTSDKAYDLLKEICPWALRNSFKVIGKNEVQLFIEKKTNIPASGNLSPQEKEKLLNLETLLGQRVIGQSEAIVGVSNAMRRSRSGTRNPNRPIGSFLFFGPTGVGKTETAKALAEVFFGDENNMSRFDMSEYQTEDALDKLIGSYSTGKSGILANTLREKPYGVVLLDEFEKTNKNVLNLFLQILDEGVFSDNAGKKVSARNIIFIATSNAGAEKIFQMVNDGKNLENSKQDIISDVVEKGTLKPELVNRFDGIIIFKPLEQNELEKIAGIMLKKLTSRMLEKGISIKYSDDTVKYVVKYGTNKVFGARPLNRFIQDSVESSIASLMIEKSLGSGSVIEVTVTEDKIKVKEI